MQNIDIESVIRGQGWSGLANTPTAQDSYQEQLEAYEAACQFIQGLSESSFQAMKAVFEAPPRFSIELGFYEGAAMGFYREGQLSMVRWIEEQKRIAEAGPPEAPKVEAPAVEIPHL